MMKELTVGIDIGGTNTKFGMVDREGNVLYQGNLQTTAYTEFQDFFDALVHALRNGLKTIPSDFQNVGIGIGAANGNYYTGNIEHATNLRWKGILPLSHMFQNEFNVPCILTNDANAAAVGEMIYGNAKQMKDFVVITLGTGLGSGFVCGGVLLNGHHGIAGEVGHTSVNPTGRYCNCGKRGCLETYVSATGIKRTVYKLLADHLEPSELRGISFDNLNTKMITDAANRGDIVAKEAFEYTGRILGMKLAETVVHTDPEAIFLFGGLSLAGDLIFKPTIRHMEANLMPLFRGKIKILPSALQNQAAPILGASSLVWDYFEKKKLEVA
ncbi:MAG: ROK family sugar kinase or transcriptional regulator [Cytophagales bacterium]|jgi:glucokinase|nr:ROK family protein [Bacteroidota bacterium]MBS1979636.1 ROK family protein [Bacteroidota bacterium]WHZ09163.1 MAG: ROK family sugar kinase or transcriptional regulator [Cytophagales bacterium]